MGSTRLKPACPAREDLSRALGVPAPDGLLELVGAAFAAAAGSADTFCHLFESAIGVIPGGEWMTAVVDGPVPWGDLRYQQTPPELLPLWTTGVDGEHGGLLVHAPELGLGEHPIATICPMDDDGVGIAALTLRDAAAYRLRCRNSPEHCEGAGEAGAESTERTRLLQSALGVEVTGLDPEPPFNWPQLLMPAGWQYSRSSDGFGVMAPAGAFAAEGIALPTPGTPLEQTIGRARALQAAGFPASALLVLREAYWNEWCYDGAIAALTPPLVETYERLGRPLLAAAAASRGEKFR